jgi:hypothetical protein
MPTITAPNFGVLGLPEGVKDAGQRVDFRPSQFDLLIENKGYRLAWERASVCPCAPVSEKTEQPDPNCDLCHGSGWFYFSGLTAQDDSDIGTLNSVQQAIVDVNSAMVIKGVITGIRIEHDPYNKVGNWDSGNLMVTVRHENVLGYYDKLIGLDIEIPFSEILISSEDSPIEGRYLMTGVNRLRSATQVYIPDVDFTLVDGKISWVLGRAPADGTRLSVHYLCHPTWLVIDHPHAVRMTLRKFKTASPSTPLGNPEALPVQAMVRYDFLPEGD